MRAVAPRQNPLALLLGTGALLMLAGRHAMRQEAAKTYTGQMGGFLMPARPRKKPTLQTVLKEEHSYIGAFESKMSRAEAALILGAIESDKNNILIRYKQLMKITHPDRGGSAYLSSKVNEAKDLLMQEEGMEAGHKQQK